MPRPKTKEQLLTQSQENFDRLFSLIEPLSAEDQNRPGVNGEWAVKDILAHLKAWHHLFFTWYQEGSQGVKPEMPAPGYTWKTTPQLNEKIFQDIPDFYAVFYFVYRISDIFTGCPWKSFIRPDGEKRFFRYGRN